MMPNMMAPNMMPMMGGMMPGMMAPNMMPMMGGMMPNMMMGGMMPMMMAKMSCEMTPAGMMMCKVMPMDGAAPEMFKDACQRMMTMMMGGMPMMMMCGGMPMMMCMPEMAK